MSKCRVCRGPAVIDLPRHNANFCGEHLLQLCRRQVEKAIERLRDARAGRARARRGSGGKDSLALWDLLLELGYEADGVYIGLGIGEYSTRAASTPRAFADRPRGRACAEIDLRHEHGYDVPTAARATRRVPCSACGLSKRHLFDAAARDGSYDAVATGHNLDDEAAVLLGYDVALERRLPRPAAPGAPRAGVPAQGQAARPPHRARDRGVVHRARHRLPGRGVPDGGRQPAPRLQGDAQRPRERDRRGPRRPSTSTSSTTWRRCWRRHAGEPSSTSLDRCSRVDRRRPATCARSVASSRWPPAMIPCRSRCCARRRARAVEPRCAPGERVSCSTRSGGATSSRSPTAASSTATTASCPHADIIGQPEGIIVRSTAGIGVPRAAADARGRRRRDATRRPGHLSQGPRADLHARRHRARRAGVRVGRRVGGAVDDDAALGRDDRRLRAARGLRQPGPHERARVPRRAPRSTTTASSSATATRGSIRPTPATGSTASCSTCPSRGRSCPTPSGRCGRAASSSPTRRRSPRRRRPAKRSRASGSTPARSRCCTAAGTSRARRCAPTTGWSPTPAFPDRCASRWATRAIPTDGSPGVRAR